MGEQISSALAAAAKDASGDEKSVDYLERFERTNCAADGSNFSPFSHSSDRPKIHQTAS